MDILESPEARLARALAMLDANRPGWADVIDLTRFEQWGVGTDVLTQLEGSWLLGLAALGLRVEDARPYGFTLSTDYWLPQILARRSAP